MFSSFSPKSQSHISDVCGYLDKARAVAESAAFNFKFAARTFQLNRMRMPGNKKMVCLLQALPELLKYALYHSFMFSF